MLRGVGPSGEMPWTVASDPRPRVTGELEEPTPLPPAPPWKSAGAGKPVNEQSPRLPVGQPGSAWAGVATELPRPDRAEI